MPYVVNDLLQKHRVELKSFRFDCYDYIQCWQGWKEVLEEVPCVTTCNVVNGFGLFKQKTTKRTENMSSTFILYHAVVRSTWRLTNLINTFATPTWWILDDKKEERHMTTHGKQKLLWSEGEGVVDPSLDMSLHQRSLAHMTSPHPLSEARDDVL